MNAAPDILESSRGPGLVENLRLRFARQFGLQVSDWLDTCAELARWEESVLVENDSLERLQKHERMLADLEDTGLWLIAAGRERGYENPELLRRIQMGLAEIRDSRAMWHGEVSGPRRSEIMRDCFNES